MPDLLLELFSEEIPARMQEDAAQALASLFTEAMKKEGFAAIECKTFVTPRRLALWAKNIPAAQADIITELKGPKLGAPEAAIQGFLKKTNLTLQQLETRDGVYFATIHQKGRPTAELLKFLIEGILQNFPWPKSMRWGANALPWVRPLHSILCLFDGKVVPVQFGLVKAGNITYGHRFLAPTAITITDPREYETKLEKAHVIADRDKRKTEILKQAQSAAVSKGLLLKKDDGLLEEVTGLVEWPVVLMGMIDAQFMDLPWQVLVSEMRAHQKYFSLSPSPPGREGAIAPHFLIVSNMTASDGGKAIIAGNERVLRARLADGRFFWDQDQKKPLAEWAKGLANVTFHAKLGSIADKVERIEQLALQLADIAKADKKLVERAAMLCKADLVTGMVGEFPELQGIMGGYYAHLQKEDPQVEAAIRDHYLPLGPSSPVPMQPVSISIALADKLDTLISMFAIGEKPTGSKDPFALRRAALGIIRIILENNLRLPLSRVIPAQAGIQASPQVQVEILAFFADRLKVQLKDSGIRHDVINAVMANGDDDLVRVVARARALQDFLASDDGRNLLVAYRRAANILSIEEKKDKIVYASADLNKAILKEQEEIALAERLFALSDRIENLLTKEQFIESMKLLAELRAPVDLFFEKIMVNCDDKALRAARLRLLAQIKEGMNAIADFALIEG